MQFAQAKLEQQFPSKLDIHWKLKVSSLISLGGLRRLIWDHTLCTCIKPCFPIARLIWEASSPEQLAHLNSWLTWAAGSHEQQADLSRRWFHVDHRVPVATVPSIENILCSAHLTYSEQNWIDWKKYLHIFIEELDTLNYQCYRTVKLLLVRKLSFATGKKSSSLPSDKRSYYCLKKSHFARWQKTVYCNA